MTQKYKYLSIFFFIFVSIFIISSFSNPVLADDDDFFGEEKPLFPLVSKDQGKELGNVAVNLLILGMAYVVVKRLYIYIRKFVNKEKHPEIIEYSKTIYMKSRKPLFYIHLATNLLATAIGIVHGLSVELEKLMMFVSGTVGVLVMVILSISGLIMWKKFWPFWSNRESKKLINAVHRQWLFSAILIVAIWSHLFVFYEK